MRFLLSSLLTLGFVDLRTQGAPQPADGRAFELEVLRQVADLSLVPPTINTDPLQQ